MHSSISTRLSLILLLLTFLSSFGAIHGTQVSADENSRPNVVIIYTDDVGYGDLSCYGATEVSTPHLDQLAARGLRFTDAHSPAATCTPSRFAMLTGQYAWRRQNTGIARGDAALIIEHQRATLADLFDRADYETAVIGKWHLGLGDGDLDWNGPIRPGPLDLGFDHAFLIPATGDRVPCVYVEDDRVVGLDPNDPITVSFRGKVGDEPTGKENPDLLTMHPSHGHDQTIVKGISRIGFMSGGESARWDDETMADVITEKAVRFIESNREQPFFLYFATHDIHVPRVPHPRFIGSTSMGPRGDAIVQMDWCVGQIVTALSDNDLLENTLLIFTSDNGPVIDDGYRDDAVEKLGAHQASGDWRGGKYSNFEAGTRIPMIVHWPAQVETGESSALMCHVDFMGTFAKMLGIEMNAEDAPDSEEHWGALIGEADAGRDSLVLQGRGLSLRQGDWKFIPAGRGPRINRNTATELGVAPEAQLYNLDTDPGETENLAAEMPERVSQMNDLLEQVKQAQRTRD